MSVSIVVPCYRSLHTLRALVSGIETEMNHLRAAGTITEWELILVVDGSPDGTGMLAQQLAAERPNVAAILLSRNFGQHNALLAGIAHARYDIVVTADDDLQHPPDQIGVLLAALDDNSVDLVYGVPVAEEHGIVRSGASRMVKTALSLAGVPHVQWVGAFRAFRTELRAGFGQVADPSPNLDVMLSWVTDSVAPVNVTMLKRQAGTSGYSFARLVRHTLNMVTGYGVVPLKLATLFGFIFGIFGIILLAVVLVSYALGETTVAGFTTLAAMVALFSGAQLISLGVVGEYLGRLHFRSMGKPTFVISHRTSMPRVAQSEDSAGGDLP